MGRYKSWSTGVRGALEESVAAPSKALVETLRRWLTELEHLEATGAATLDSCEMLVELHELLDKLYTMMLERARQTLQ
jgi:hypothetical protein